MSILLSNKHLTVERASCCLTSILLWNGHLAVERASCCGTGILLWNGHLAVERASCPLQFPGRQDAHPTHIPSKIQQCQHYWVNSQLSQFPTYSKIIPPIDLPSTCHLTRHRWIYAVVFSSKLWKTFRVHSTIQST
ncbi:hypothetical protein [Moorena sp. SIO4G3]|uniref:hypothetical protein n=1 Tax=Moorena sp. SIO4G3 TaxID=2607821 RepID=UPI00142BE789|nr:hypothetical protein [Moorena sp. SIO4G3]NEO78937.1 hypothetical protein [Moorena sp. SIO4G3]